MTAKIAILATLTLFVLAGAAQAGCTQPPAGYKGFGKADFPQAGGRAATADGLSLDVPKNSFATWLATTTVTDAWICVALRFPASKPDSQVGAGVVFWGVDTQNFHVAAVRRDGSFAIWRHAPAGWTTLASGSLAAYYVNGPQAPLVRAGPAAGGAESDNQIEVVTLGDTVRVIVNGRSVIQWKDFPSGRATSVGVYAEAEADSDARWLIDSVSVAELCHESQMC
jgi:hypothetical protein